MCDGETREALTVTLDFYDWVLIGRILDGYRTWLPDAVVEVDRVIERGKAMVETREVSGGAD